MDYSNLVYERMERRVSSFTYDKRVINKRKLDEEHLVNSVIFVPSVTSKSIILKYIYLREFDASSFCFLQNLKRDLLESVCESSNGC